MIIKVKMLFLTAMKQIAVRILQNKRMFAKSYWKNTKLSRHNVDAVHHGHRNLSSHYRTASMLTRLFKVLRIKRNQFGILLFNKICLKTYIKVLIAPIMVERDYNMDP